jgi:predicted nucleic acid-binding protein
VIVAADSSPLVILAKIGCFDFLHRLYPRLYISAEVHREVVIAGAGLPGASEVAKAEWIEVLLDDYNARKLAAAEGLQVRGSVGLLETFYLKGYLTDLRGAFRQLLTHSYIDQRLLELRLRALGLPPL